MNFKTVLLSIVVLGLGGLTWFFSFRSRPKTGIELTGGARLTYEMLLQPDDRPRSDAIRQHLISILADRARLEYGTSEVSVTPNGHDEIVIEMPNRTPRLSEPEGQNEPNPNIQFYWAKNVVTDLARNRRYRAIKDVPSIDRPVCFEDTTLGPKTARIKPSMPEYLRVLRGWDLILQGNDIVSARAATYGKKGAVLITFSSYGAQKIRAWCEKHQNQREALAIVLAGQVVNLDYLDDGVILDRTEMISDPAFTPGYAKSLADVIWNGTMNSIEMKLVRREKFEPQTGRGALSSENGL